MIESVQHGVINLFAVEQNILRGGQPTAEGWSWLKSEGITDVIKLDTEGESSDAIAGSMGMTVHRFPIPWWQQVLLRPPQSLLVAAVACIKGNMFIHCEHGQDRTGLIVGCFRLSQGWTKSDAYAEMLEHGFHENLLGGLKGRWNTQNPDDWKVKSA